MFCCFCRVYVLTKRVYKNLPNMNTFCDWLSETTVISAYDWFFTNYISIVVTNHSSQSQSLFIWVRGNPRMPNNIVDNTFNNLGSKTFRTNVASVGSVFNDTRKVKVLSLPETIKEKSTFRAKALRREWTINSRRRAFARNVDFSFIVSGSERTFTFRAAKHCLILFHQATSFVYFFAV